MNTFLSILFTTLRSLPMLGIALLLANIFALVEGALDWQLFTISLPSGGDMGMSAGNLVVILGLLTLVFEILKTTLGRIAPMRAQIGTVVVLIIAILEWLFIPSLAHVSMLLLILMIVADLLVELFFPRSARRLVAERNHTALPTAYGETSAQ